MAIAHLSKWDFSVEFMLYEAAALIVGIDPVEIYTSTEPAQDNSGIYDYHGHPQIKPAVDRMKLDYFSALDLYSAIQDGEWKYSSAQPLPSSVLRNREMETVPLEIMNLDSQIDPVSQALLDTWRVSEDGVYETTKFTRTELSRWLSANCLKSVYQFDLELKKPVSPVNESKPTTPEEVAESDIDPADLPDELHAANIAFRAVTNGHGDPLATFRNRLIGYLKTNFPGLNNEAVQRIATVANPDKTTGRKKANAE